MLELASDRLDYGHHLRPPAGYVFSGGVCTSYSLDLETLTAASLALTLDQSLDDAQPCVGIAFLESLNRLEGKLAVFYHRGNIKVPQKMNQLFTLLEPLLAPVVAIEGVAGLYSSFHPKMWLLRFAAEDGYGPQKMRMLILSRNLTFDRSWDLAVSLDGIPCKRSANANAALVTFLKALHGQKSHHGLIASLCDDLRSIKWEPPRPFTELEVQPGLGLDKVGVNVAPIDLNGPIDELLVVSPFVDADAKSLLMELGSRTAGERTLISRADTLNGIGGNVLSHWTCYSLCDAIVDVEERLEIEAPNPQELHAKLVVAQQGSQAVWHVGSANMTNAAFGNPKQGIAPRNRELMLRLAGKNEKVGPAIVMKEWLRSGVFRNHEFDQPKVENAAAKDALRRVIHALTSATWSITAVGVGDGKYDMTLAITPFALASRGYRVTVGVLGVLDRREISPLTIWSGINLRDLSAFVLVKAVAEDGELEASFVVQADFPQGLMADRKKAVFKETIGTGENLVRYLALILDTESTKSSWLRDRKGNGQAADIFGLDGRGALYEQLLRAAARAPQRLARSLEVFSRVKDDIELPSGLTDLLESFTIHAGSSK